MEGTTHILLLLLAQLSPLRTMGADLSNQELSNPTDSLQNSSGRPITTTWYTASSNVDMMCGNHHRLPADSSGECDPAGDYPCCNAYRCGNTNYQCTCKNCVDYRVVEDLRASETNCTITRVGDFLKTVCSHEENQTKYYFKCINSDVIYHIYSKYTKNDAIKVSNVCDKDNYAYQSCVFHSDMRKNYKSGDVLCGG